jgi:hypothetical protein
VAETLLGKETRSREIRPLGSIPDHNAKYLLTMDKDEYSHNGIRHLNIIDWRLG